MRVRPLSVFVFLLISACSSWAASAFVRVNQLGYEPHTASRAFLMVENGSAVGVPFRVLDAAGKVAFKGTAGADLGAWGKFHVAALDFEIDRAGTYSIAVAKPSAVSPAFPVAKPGQLYSQALTNALEFYQNERDGSDYIPSPLRTAPGHLNDRSAQVYLTPDIDDNDVLVGDLTPTGAHADAEGGWWDAGDYLKFVQTHSYAVSLMLAGVRDFPEQMGAFSASSNFTAEAKFGLKWLLKMWDDDHRILYYQVGIGTGNDAILSDHDIWRLPQEDDTYGGTDPAFKYIRNRPLFVAGPAGAKISPNLAGRLAASFALGAQVFRNSDPRLALRCLLAAEHVFDLADTNPSGNLLTTAPFDFYPESEWRDDLELGATELHFALRQMPLLAAAQCPHADAGYYLRAAAHWANAYITGPGDAADTLNLYDVSGLAHFELYRAIADAGHPGALETSQPALLADIEKELSHATAQAATDPFGFGFPWAAYDTATHGAGLSVMASEYAFLTGSADWKQYGQRWAANILGANAWGASFIVGDGETFPDCMQHQVANIVGSLDGSNPRLNGALVEGPNTSGTRGFLDGMRACPAEGGNPYRKFNGNGAVFMDNVQSYSTVEPAIDLTAASFLMFSWAIAGAPGP